MKEFFLICIFLLGILSSSAQKPIEILSFDYHIIYDDPEWRTGKGYIINALMKYDNGSIIQKSDTIHFSNPDLKKIIQVRYSISNDDYYKVDTQISYKGIKMVKQDSLLLYIPIEKKDEQVLDTLTTLLFSKDLAKMQESKYYNSKSKYNSIRITILYDNYSEMYRLEKILNRIELTYKRLSHNDEESVLESNTIFLVSNNRYKKYFNSIFEKKLLEKPNNNSMLPHDILLECNSNDAFDYRKINSYKLESFNKDIYDCIQLLKKLIKSNR